MAITQINGDATTYPTTIERREGGDGAAGFWENTAVPLINRTAYLYDQLLGGTNGFVTKLASQAVGAFGTALVGQRAVVDANQGTLAAGTLLSAIQALWLGKAGLAGTNVFTGSKKRSGATAVDAWRGPTTILASSTTTVIDNTADVWEFFTPSHIGTISVKVTALTQPMITGELVTLSVYNVAIGQVIKLIRDDASEIVRSAANGGVFTVSLRWNGTKYRFHSSGGDVLPDFFTGPATL